MHILAPNEHRISRCHSLIYLVQIVLPSSLVYDTPVLVNGGYSVLQYKYTTIISFHLDIHSVWCLFNNMLFSSLY